MQNEVKNKYYSTSGSPVVPQPISIEEKMQIDRRSVYVGNVLILIFFIFV